MKTEINTNDLMSHLFELIEKNKYLLKIKKITHKLDVICQELNTISKE